MKNLILAFILISSGMTNCQNKSDKSDNKKPEKDLIRMNDYAAELSTKNGDNRDSTLKALKIINEVLERDSSLATSQNNKLVILLKLKEREQALDLINKIISKNNRLSNNHIIKANILEKMDRKQEAIQEYLKALNICEQNLKNDPNNIKAKINLIQMHLFTKPIEDVKNEYYQLKKDYPTNANVIIMEEMVTKFDRAKFLEMY